MAIARFSRRYPGVALDLREKVSLELADDLLAHRIDAALLRPMPRRALTGLHSMRVDREPLVLAVPRSHRLANLTSVPLKKLEGEPLIGFSPQDSPYFCELLEQLFAGSSVRTQGTVKSVLPTILALVEAGLGVAVVPRSATVLREQLLAYRPLIAVRQPKAELNYLTRAGDENPIVASFAKCLTHAG